jgi:DNA polymerase I-like protein with 3'-5' exonuclease and polymerase domains
MPGFHYSWQNPVRREWIGRDLQRFFTLPDPIEPAFHVVSETEDLRALFRDKAQLYLDVETTGVEYFGDKITLLGLTDEASEEVWIFDHPTPERLSELLDLINHKAKLVIGHNLTFDLGMYITNTQRDDILFPVKDTMVMAFLLGHDRKSLKHLTAFLTDRPGSRSYGSFTSFGYLAEDVLSTRDLYHVLEPYCRDIFAMSLMHDLVVKFAVMRYRGVNIDQRLLGSLELDYSEMLEGLEKELRAKKLGEAVNFNAPAQLGKYLVANGVKLTETTASGQLSTSEAVLLKTEHPVAKKVLEYRAAAKDHQWLVSYDKFCTLSPFGHLHPRMKMTTARTGRMSCSDPNLQQVPRVGPVKQIFISKFKGGYIGLVDLAQAELRVAALLSEDPAFIDALNSEDVHRAMAAKVFKKPENDVSPYERKKSKGVTFGKLYGGSNAGLAKRMGIAEEEVAEVEHALFTAFPVLAQTLDKLAEHGVTHGQISTPFGRIRDLREMIFLEGEGSAGRKAKNTPIQSVASDIMLVITNAAQTHLERCFAKSHIIFGVHDSGLYDIHPDEVELVAEAISIGFQALCDTPLSTFSTFGQIEFGGELIVGRTWANIEDTNEGFDCNYIYACSSHSPAPVLKKVTHYRDVTNTAHVAADVELEPVLQSMREEAAEQTQTAEEEETPSDDQAPNE